MSDIPKRFTTLQKLATRHEKRAEKFMLEAEKFFKPHALTLLRRIKRGIPEINRAFLGMRHLYLEPREIEVNVINPAGEKVSEHIGNIFDYLDADSEWKLDLPEDVQEALRELDALADYIDDNYSMVNGLDVEL